jgi:tetratricopeptide (TPR) repeat protein
MYIQGELYPQAIAEIRAVLGQDPKRTDMQVLLAQAYFKSGQKADASDLCTQLLKQFPYCFEANRIMAEIVPSSGRTQATIQAYRARVSDLDPYAAHARGSVYESNAVADNAVTLERLEYAGEAAPAGQNWGTSLGLGLGASSAAAIAANSSPDQPDWLKEASADFATAAPQAAPPAATASPAPASAEIPGFLRQAGWGESSGAPEQPVSFFDTAEPAGGALSPAEIPDWLKGQEPTSGEAGGSSTDFSSETPDWLSGLGGGGFTESASAPAGPGPNLIAGTPAAAADAAPDWLSSLGGTQLGEAAVAPGEMPDWLGGRSAPQPQEQAAAADAAPDWLSSLGGTQPGEAAAGPGEMPGWLGGRSAPQPQEQAAAADEAPDWLAGLGAGTVQDPSAGQSGGEVPDWLIGNAARPADKPATVQMYEPPETPDWLANANAADRAATITPGAFEAAGPAQEADLPDWIKPPGESPGASPQEQEDAIAWLESLAAKHGAKPEELVTDPSRRSEAPPEWVERAQAVSQPKQTLPPEASLIENLGASAQEQDDAVAWLESLAAKHGAKPEELVTDPSKRSESPPEWVEQARAASGIQPPAQAAAPAQDLGTTPQEQDDAVAWLESLAAKHGAKPEELVTDPSKRSETPPDWVQQARADAEALAGPATASADSQGEWSEMAQDIGEQFFSQFEQASTPNAADQDRTGVWLRERQEEDELSRLTTPPPTPTEDLPRWMDDSKLPAAEAEAAAPKTDLPGWLSGLGDGLGSEEYVAQHVPAGDLTDWLSGLDEESALPTLEAGPAADDSLPDWLAGAESAEEKASGARAEPTHREPEAGEPASVPPAGELPGWLQGMEKGADLGEEQEAPWMRSGAAAPEPAPPKPKPTTPDDWHPAGTKPEPPRMADLRSRPPMPKPKPSAELPSSEPVYGPIDEEWPAPEPTAESLKPVIFSPVPPRQPLPTPQAPPPAKPPAQPAPPPAQLAAQKPPPARKAAPRAPEAQPAASAISQAKEELERGDIPAALEHYSRLIKKGRNLEETIRDLSDSIYRYPVEVGIWQTLGDAYMRANRLKEALDAYNKAEELIR